VIFSLQCFDTVGWATGSFARLIAPVVIITSIFLCFNKHRLTQVHLENGRWNGERERERLAYYLLSVVIIIVSVVFIFTAASFLSFFSMDFESETKHVCFFLLILSYAWRGIRCVDKATDRRDRQWRMGDEQAWSSAESEKRAERTPELAWPRAGMSVQDWSMWTSVSLTLFVMFISSEEVMFSLTFVCLFAGLHKNYSADFSKNSMEWWHMDHGRNRWILMVIRITLR